MISRFLRPHLASAEPYTPGDQLPGPIVKLNTNECPYPPSPRVAEAIMAAAKKLNRYSSSDADETRFAFAKNFNISPNRVCVGNGSDEILRIAFQAYVAPGDRVAWSTPTYTLYEVLANFAEAQLIDVPRNADFSCNVRQLGALRAKLTILCNPNSPTGTVTSIDDLRILASFGNLLLIDEAYADFAGSSAIELVNEFDNVIIVRTLSKSYALAGLRVGFAIAREEIIYDFRRLKDSYNVSVLANAGAAAALEDQSYAAALREKIIASRGRLEKELTKRGFVVHKSGTNFLLAVPPDGNGERVYKMLRDHNVIVRWFGADSRIAPGIRITVGTDEEIDRLLEVIDKNG